jgi:choline dehydrogenase-like flavoprotein
MAGTTREQTRLHTPGTTVIRLIQKPVDVCIVGAGIAGALVAATLVRRGRRVVIIEAGGRFDRAQRFAQLEEYLTTGIAWPYQRGDRDRYVDTSPDFRYDLATTRVKAVGGSTLHWGGTSQRLDPSDFRTRTTYGYGDDWPISYDDLEPYYLKAEHEIGVAGDSAAHAEKRSGPFPMEAFPDSFSDPAWRRAAARIGATVEKVPYAKNTRARDGRPECAAFSTCTICPIGAQYSADVHIAEAERSGLCVIMPNTVARRIEVDAKGFARAVHATGLDGSDHVVAARHVVVAAHAIESARLLLLSGIGNAGDNVGRYLMEHFYAAGEGVVSGGFFPGRIGFETLQSSSFYNGNERRATGAIKLELCQGTPPLRSPRSTKLWGKELADFSKEHFGRLAPVSAETEHRPHRESRIDLDPAVKDMFGDPVPRIHFHLTEFEHATRARGARVVERLLEAAGARDIQTQTWPRWAAHHMGTCRMSADPERGVVDRDLKVFGTTNLHVVGSGAFTTGGAVQPTLTIAALALRLGERLVAAGSGGE